MSHNDVGLCLYAFWPNCWIVAPCGRLLSFSNSHYCHREVKIDPHTHTLIRLRLHARNKHERHFSSTFQINVFFWQRYGAAKDLQGIISTLSCHSADIYLLNISICVYEWSFVCPFAFDVRNVIYACSYLAFFWCLLF